MAEAIKVHILFPFREGPWGGSNQFLSALRRELCRVGAWAESPAEADVILFDSFNSAGDVIAWKRLLTGTAFVQRVDGPVSRYRGANRHVDELIHALGRSIADGIIFQSAYSERANLVLGMSPPSYSTTILNAPGADYVRRSAPHNSSGERIRLIASSWSPNPNKGFEVYRHLDEELDFRRYRMTFVGNSPISFRNIDLVPPLDSAGLSALLRESDIYITASVDDPCSNSLIEAMASGLPAVALNSGGHPELIGRGGVLFEGSDDVIAAIDEVASQIDCLRTQLPSRSITSTAVEYVRFMSEVNAHAQPRRRLSTLEALKLRTLLPIARLKSKIGSKRLPAWIPPKVTNQHAEGVLKTIARKAYRLVRGTQVIVACVLPRPAGLAVHYGGARVGDVGGPLVKVKRLTEHFPNHPIGFNLVYLLSNAPYVPAPALRVLKARGIPIVVNQNGVFYPGWYGGDWRTPNRIMGELFHEADWVFYQSEFCRRAAQKFLGERAGAGEILYNAVDTRRFKPLPRSGDQRPFTFLITGKIGNHLSYRLESTISGLAAAREQGLDARLHVAGWVDAVARRTADAHARRLGVASHLIFSGRYRQEDGPSIYGGADAYVMTKYNDPCPNTVLEALACGLPVLYSASGGVPELVGLEAGIGLDCGEENWERPLIPTTESIAAGMIRIADASGVFAQAARQRAVERFDISHWLDRHRAVFAQLLEKHS